MVKGLLVNSTNIDKQLLFPTGSPICTLSTFPEGGDGGLVGDGVVRKYLTKENCKLNLGLDLVSMLRSTYTYILESSTFVWSYCSMLLPIRTLMFSIGWSS